LEEVWAYVSVAFCSTCILILTHAITQVHTRDCANACQGQRKLQAPTRLYTPALLRFETAWQTAGSGWRGVASAWLPGCLWPQATSASAAPLAHAPVCVFVMYVCACMYIKAACMCRHIAWHSTHVHLKDQYSLLVLDLLHHFLHANMCEDLHFMLDACYQTLVVSKHNGGADFN